MIWLRLYIDFLVFAFGAVIGSFLNVCIYRMPLDQSIVSPPSHCPNCNEHIRWIDNIPLVSYLALGRKCRHCGVRISPRYFLVELLTAVLFLLMWLKLTQWDPAPAQGLYFLKGPIYWLILAGLIVATFIDFEHFIIPNEITLGGIVVGLILSTVYPPLQPADFVTTGILASVHVALPAAIVSLFRSFIGMLVGGLTLWMVVEAGKVFFGRYRVYLKTGSVLTLRDRILAFETMPGRSRTPSYRLVAMVRRWVRRCLPHAWNLRAKLRKLCETLRTPLPSPGEWHQTLALEEIFARESDRILFHAHTITFGDKTLENVDVTISETELAVGTEMHALATIGPIEARSDEVVLPREAMGFGDVKLLAALGAFLGWEATLFIVFASSMIGGVIGLLLVILGRADLQSRIPYGPYIAFGAILWLFFGVDIVQWYANSLKG